MTEQTLYERLGGVYAIAAVIDRFSDRLLNNPKIVNANPELKQWHTEEYKTRMPGLKFNRTLWVCAVAGGPYEYTAKKLDDAHFNLHISPEVFDEVAFELADTLDYYKVPEGAKQEVLAAFNAHKPEVTAGSLTAG
jgi:hemoglobin